MHCCCCALPRPNRIFLLHGNMHESLAWTVSADVQCPASRLSRAAWHVVLVVLAGNAHTKKDYMMGQYSGLTTDNHIEYFGRFITSCSSALAYRAATRILQEAWGANVHVQLLVTDTGHAGNSRGRGRPLVLCILWPLPDVSLHGYCAERSCAEQLGACLQLCWLHTHPLIVAAIRKGFSSENNGVSAEASRVRAGEGRVCLPPRLHVTVFHFFLAALCVCAAGRCREGQDGLKGRCSL